MAKYCPNCGTENVDTNMVCTNCGVAFVQQAAPTPVAPVQQAAPTEMAAAPVIEQPVAPVQQAAPVQSGAKSKVAAGLLGLFLGGFGIHNFYLGNSKKGAIQIVVTLVTCGLGSWWGFIEGIMILAGSIKTDANGNPLV